MLTTLLAATLVKPDQLAFVARFYKPGKAKSTFQVYLSQLDGTERHALKMPVEPWRVAWIGKDHLAVSSEGGIYLSAVKNWRPKLIPNSKGLQFSDSRDRISPPGEPQLYKDADPTDQRIDAKTGVLTANMGKPAYTEIRPGDSEDKFEIEEPNGRMITLQFAEPFSYEASGKMVRCEIPFRRGWLSPSCLFLVVGDHDSTSGDTNGLLVFEKSKAPRFVFDRANAFDFWEERSVYAFCTPRGTSPLNPKDKESKLVWSSELHVGDWRKGTDRTLLTGAVYVPSVSIRP